MNKKEHIFIDNGEKKFFELPDPPEQAPTFFRWRVDFGGGDVEFNEERDTFSILGENPGRHVISFVPSTSQGKTLMSAQYTGCGEDHKFIVIVKR